MASNGSWKFNSPPGWPVPPEGWVPPPNWQPDPSWPAPPPNWPMWVPVGFPPAPRASRFSTAAKVLAGAVSLLATLAATWFAFLDRPDPYTSEQWRAKANTACERGLADVQLSMTGVMLKIGQAMRTLPPPGEISDDMTEAVESVAELSRAFRRLAVDLREIEVPEDMDPADLVAFLAATDEIGSTVGDFGNLMVQYQLGQADMTTMQRVNDRMTNLNTITIPEWRAANQRLGLDRCLAFIGT